MLTKILSLKKEEKKFWQHWHFLIHIHFTFDKYHIDVWFYHRLVVRAAAAAAATASNVTTIQVKSEEN